MNHSDKNWRCSKTNIDMEIDFDRTYDECCRKL